MDSIPTTSARLNNKAAYDKIAVRPKDRKAARKARGVSQIVHVDTHVNGFGGLSPTTSNDNDENGSRESSPKAKRSRPPSLEPLELVANTPERSNSMQKRFSMGKSPLGPGSGMPVSLADVQGMQGKLRKVSNPGERPKAGDDTKMRKARALTDSMKTDPAKSSDIFSGKLKSPTTEKPPKNEPVSSAKQTYLSRKFGLSKSAKPTLVVSPDVLSSGAEAGSKKVNQPAVPLSKFESKASQDKSPKSPESKSKGLPLPSVFGKRERSRTSPVVSSTNTPASRGEGGKQANDVDVPLSKFGKLKSTLSPTSPQSTEGKAMGGDSQSQSHNVTKTATAKNKPLASPISPKDGPNSDAPKAKPAKDSKVSAAAKFFSGAGGAGDRARKKSQGEVNHSENNSKRQSIDGESLAVVADFEKQPEAKESDDLHTNADVKKPLDMGRERLKSTEKEGVGDELASLRETKEAKTEKLEATTEVQKEVKSPTAKPRVTPKPRSPSPAAVASSSVGRKESNVKDKKPERKPRATKEKTPVPTYRLLDPQAPELEEPTAGKKTEEKTAGETTSPDSDSGKPMLQTTHGTKVDTGERKRSVSTPGYVESAKASPDANGTTAPEPAATSSGDNKTKTTLVGDLKSPLKSVPESNKPADNTSTLKTDSERPETRSEPLYSRANLKPIGSRGGVGSHLEGRRNVSMKINSASSPSRTQRAQSFNVGVQPDATARADKAKLVSDKGTAKVGADTVEAKKVEQAKTVREVSTPESKVEQKKENVIKDVENNNNITKPIPAINAQKPPKDVARESTPTAQARRNSKTTPTEVKSSQGDKDGEKDGQTPAWVRLARRRSKVWEESGMKSLRAVSPRRPNTVDSGKIQDRPKSLSVSQQQPTSAIKSQENTPKTAPDVHRKQAQVKDADPTPAKSASPLTPSSKVPLNRKPQTPETNASNARRYTPHATKDPSSGQPSWLAIAMQKQKRWTKEEAV